MVGSANMHTTIAYVKIRRWERIQKGYDALNDHPLIKKQAVFNRLFFTYFGFSISGIGRVYTPGSTLCGVPGILGGGASISMSFV